MRSYKEVSEEVYRVFEQEIKKIGLSIIRIDEEGYIYISNEEMDYKIHLDNSIKNYLDTGAKDTLYSVINLLKENRLGDDRFEDIKSEIYFSIVPVDNDNEKNISFEFSEELRKIIVYYDGKYIHWITEDNLEKWEVNVKELLILAGENINRELKKAHISYYDLDEINVCYFETDFYLRSELILSNQLRSKVEPKIGWPIYTVFPNRNSCYLIPRNELEKFVELFGEIVLEEYEEAYSISRGIYEVKDTGFELIGLLSEE